MALKRDDDIRLGTYSGRQRRGDDDQAAILSVVQSRRVQLMHDGYCLRRAVAVLVEDEICSPAVWIVGLGRVRPDCELLTAGAPFDLECLPLNLAIPATHQ
jgi:hypothetical protein